MEFIACDRAGWDESQSRFTHQPSGNTLLCLLHWSEQETDQAKLNWLQKYDGNLTVHDCPYSYSMNGKLIGTVQELCDDLTLKISNTRKES